jgi:hypothetical protein
MPVYEYVVLANGKEMGRTSDKHKANFMQHLAKQNGIKTEIKKERLIYG